MNALLKFFFTILGSGLAGFGVGILAHKNNVLSGQQFEVAIVMSLIAGGFFLALGLPGKKIKDESERAESSRSSAQE